MCNIAGYSGTKNAAPILLEMLKRQEAFDGGVCCGIVTVYEGRLYCRKIVGDVDTLVRTTNALYLPGTVGIAHTRPVGDGRRYNFAQPFIAEGGRLAGMTNGSTRGIGYSEKVQAATEFLEDNGYEFMGGTPLEECGFPKLKNGNYVSCVETRTNLVSYYVNRGYDIHTAMARAASECYTDSVLGILSLDTPRAFHILRTTRPAFSVTTDDGTYVASCPFAFPDDLGDKCTSLPLMRPCAVTKEGVEISEVRMSDCEEVGEFSDKTLEIGYDRISAMLKGKADEPLIFDTLENAVWKDMRDLFAPKSSLIEDAKLVYTVLYRLHKEGKLKRSEITLHNKKRYNMWIE